jgi:steroid delta-isomerase-like uncharacterized protein
MGIKDVLARWVAAMNAHDAVRLADLYSPEAQLLYGWGELVAGQSEIAEHFCLFFRSFPNWAKEPFSLIQGAEDWAALEWRGEATFLEAYRGTEPTGRSFHLRGCGVFHFVDGRISLQRRYFDRRSWYQQMGLQ